MMWKVHRLKMKSRKVPDEKREERRAGKDVARRGTDVEEANR